MQTANLQVNSNNDCHSVHKQTSEPTRYSCSYAAAGPHTTLNSNSNV